MRAIERIKIFYPHYSDLNLVYLLMPHKMTYIVADDDELFLMLIQQYLQYIPDLECIGAFNNSIPASNAIQNLNPDLLISDVEMPLLNGIQLVKSLNKLPLIIFVSSHKEYAVDAFEVDAVDFLTKPLLPERLIRSIDKVRQLIKLRHNTEQYEGFKMGPEESFFIRENSAYLRIPFNDVVYIESLDDFVNIFLQNNTKKIALVSLKNLEKQLPSSHFVRISRSHIVNKNKISSLDSNNLMLDKIRLNIGKTYGEHVIESVIGNKAIKRHL